MGIIEHKFSLAEVFDAIEYARSRPMPKGERPISISALQAAFSEIARLRTGVDHPSFTDEPISLRHSGPVVPKE